MIAFLFMAFLMPFRLIYASLPPEVDPDACDEALRGMNENEFVSTIIGWPAVAEGAFHLGVRVETPQRGVAAVHGGRGTVPDHLIEFWARKIRLALGGDRGDKASIIEWARSFLWDSVLMTRNQAFFRSIDTPSADGVSRGYGLQIALKTKLKVGESSEDPLHRDILIQVFYDSTTRTLDFEVPAAYLGVSEHLVFRIQDRSFPGEGEDEDDSDHERQVSRRHRMQYNRDHNFYVYNTISLYDILSSVFPDDEFKNIFHYNWSSENPAKFSEPSDEPVLVHADQIYSKGHDEPEARVHLFTITYLPAREETLIAVVDPVSKDVLIHKRLQGRVTKDAVKALRESIVRSALYQSSENVYGWFPLEKSPHETGFYVFSDIENLETTGRFIKTSSPVYNGVLSGSEHEGGHLVVELNNGEVRHYNVNTGQDYGDGLPEDIVDTKFRPDRGSIFLTQDLLLLAPRVDFQRNSQSGIVLQGLRGRQNKTVYSWRDIYLASGMELSDDDEAFTGKLIDVSRTGQYALLYINITSGRQDHKRRVGRLTLAKIDSNQSRFESFRLIQVYGVEQRKPPRAGFYAHSQGFWYQQASDLESRNVILGQSMTDSRLSDSYIYSGGTFFGTFSVQPDSLGRPWQLIAHDRSDPFFSIIAPFEFPRLDFQNLVSRAPMHVENMGSSRWIPWVQDSQVFYTLDPGSDENQRRSDCFLYDPFTTQNPRNLTGLHLSQVQSIRSLEDGQVEVIQTDGSLHRGHPTSDTQGSAPIREVAGPLASVLGISVSLDATAYAVLREDAHDRHTTWREAHLDFFKIDSTNGPGRMLKKTIELFLRHVESSEMSHRFDISSEARRGVWINDNHFTDYNSLHFWDEKNSEVENVPIAKLKSPASGRGEHPFFVRFAADGSILLNGLAAWNPRGKEALISKIHSINLARGDQYALSARSPGSEHAYLAVTEGIGVQDDFIKLRIIDLARVEPGSPVNFEGNQYIPLPLTKDQKREVESRASSRFSVIQHLAFSRDGKHLWVHYAGSSDRILCLVLDVEATLRMGRPVVAAPVGSLMGRDSSLDHSLRFDPASPWAIFHNAFDGIQMISVPDAVLEIP